MINTTIAHYKITAKLGQGGMGEVYRATDTKLDREVAIKVLPESFAQDKERVARFDREAKALAALNHPNIAGIHGIEEEGDLHALIMELVEGNDLSQRLKSGPLPVEEALDVCKQIAEALEAAHGKGIIHRDLKPGNIKLTEDGKVKVLDFGLAKALKETESSVIGDDVSQDPTITDHSTKPGTVLGTAAYMSPEQAKGHRVDKRSDNWSFGCVLFECLTGKRPFGGADKTDTLASILKSEPDWGKLPTDTPPTVQLLLRKCLAKDPKRRLHDIADARVDLDEAIADPSSSFIGLSEGAWAGTSKRNGVPLAIVIGVAVVAVALTWFLKPAPVVPESPAAAPVDVSPSEPSLDILAEVHPPENTLIESVPEPAISPDGKWLAYLTDNNRPTVLRELSTGTQRFVGQDYSDWPANYRPVKDIFFSKDSRYLYLCVFDIGIVEIEIGNGSNELSRIPLTFSPSGADWVSQDMMVVAFEDRDGLFSFSPSPGDQEPRKIELKWAEGPLDTSSALFKSPDHVEGTKLIIATRLKMGTRNGDIVLVNYETGECSVLVSDAMGGQYLAPDYLLFVQRNNLYAWRFDKSRGELIGEKELIRPLTPFSTEHGRVAYAASDIGMLVYKKGFAEETYETEFVWIDMKGEQLPGEKKIRGKVVSSSLSPDGQQMVILANNAGFRNVKIVDLKSEGTVLPVSISPDSQYWVRRYSHWASDDYIYFTKLIDDQRAIVRTKVEFFKEPDVFVRSSTEEIDPKGVTPAGELILSMHLPDTGWGIFKTGTDPDGNMQELFDLESHDGDPSISPDGNWIAFSSNWSSRGRGPARIYARMIDDLDTAPFPVSRYSGESWATRPIWHPTENKLYYFIKLPPLTVMEVTYRIEGSKFETVVEKELFRLQDPDLVGLQFHPDGDRFLVRREPQRIERPNSSTASDKHLTIKTDLYGLLEEKLGPRP